MNEKSGVANRLDAMYRDLEVKATLDADETVRLLEALIAVFAGREPDGMIPGEPGQALPGMSPRALAGEAAALRKSSGDTLNVGSIIALRDSLYRFQSLVERR